MTTPTSTPASKEIPLVLTERELVVLWESFQEMNHKCLRTIVIEGVTFNNSNLDLQSLTIKLNWAIKKIITGT